MLKERKFYIQTHFSVNKDMQLHGNTSTYYLVQCDILKMNNCLKMAKYGRNMKH
jgi:hypothetical protein